MKTAKRVLKKPVGFQAGAVLFQLSTSIDYRTQTISLAAGRATANLDQTKFVVLSPGNNNCAKIFPANKDGFCVSWFSIDEFPNVPEPAAAMHKLGYKLIS